MAASPASLQIFIIISLLLLCSANKREGEQEDECVYLSKAERSQLADMIAQQPQPAEKRGPLDAVRGFRSFNGGRTGGSKPISSSRIYRYSYDRKRGPLSSLRSQG